jgi:phosphoglycolate phosphatase
MPHFSPSIPKREGLFMLPYSVLLFDLDGTLTDSAPGITNAVAYALEHFHIPVPPQAELFRFVGPPLMDSFRTFYGMGEAQAQEATDTFRQYYNRQGVLENRPYPGVAEFLADLRAGGYTLAVATSKPQHLADEVLGRYGLDGYFSAICGASLDESRNQKYQVIEDALARCGVSDPATVLMIGDRRHDVEGAQRNGIDAMGILYGYGSREELEAAGATYVCADFAEMRRVLLPKE